MMEEKQFLYCREHLHMSHQQSLTHAETTLGCRKNKALPFWDSKCRVNHMVALRLPCMVSQFNAVVPTQREIK